jgi:hypothetical protein
MKKSISITPLPNLSKRKSFPLTISTHLFDLLKSRVLKIKSQEDYSYTRQQWINQAIREKIEIDKEKQKKNSTVLYKQPKQKRLALLLEDKIVEEIDALLSERRALGDVSFSKKSWIIEAIKEKLSRDTHS